MLMRSARCALSTVLVVLGCSTTSGGNRATTPDWTTTVVDYGQGQIHLRVRFRWIAEREVGGARIRTPDGGQATVRIFNCGKPKEQLKKLIRKQLRGRLLLSELAEHGRVISWRWRRRRFEGRALGTAMARHGPLLIAVTSATIEPADLIRVADKMRLSLPLPTINGCFPLCVEGVDCKPQTSEDEG